MSVERAYGTWPWEVLHEPNVGQVAQLTCKYCHATERVTLRRHLPATVISKIFAGKGWPVSERTKAVGCEACKTKFKSMKKQEKRKMSKLHIVDKGPPDPTKLQLREIFRLLDAHFDEDARLYKNGYSDERIAEEVKVAPIIVRQERKELYAELALPPEFEAIQSEMAALRQEIESASAMLRDLAKRTERTITKYRD
jgi:hypothetical protein